MGTKIYAKRDTRLKTQEGLHNTYVNWDKALGTKETAPQALKTIVDAVAKTHGIDISELLGTPSTQTTVPEGREFEYEGERKAYELAKEDAKKEIAAEYGLDPSLLADLKKEREASQKDRAIESWLDQNSKKVFAEADKLEGWKVTRDMLRIARLKFPDEKPLRALKQAYPNRYANAVSTRKAVQAKKGPEMLDGATARGRQPVKNWEAYDIHEAYAETRD